MRWSKLAAYKVGLLCLSMIVMLGLVPVTNAQQAATLELSGKFSGGDRAYNTMPIVVGLTDASGFFGKDPDFVLPQADQIVAKTTGVADSGTYNLTLPSTPKGRPLNGNASLEVFDVRLMSDAAHRGYLASNEDIIGDSLNLDVDLTVRGGTLLVWAADANQKLSLPSGTGSPVAVPQGWSLFNLNTHLNSPVAALDLTTAGTVDQVDYSKLSCDKLVPALLDRAQKFYPFTELHHIDWDSLRSKLLPAAKSAASITDCQRVIRDFGNAIPDGHVDFSLPALRDDYAGSAGLILAQTTDGAVVVSSIRSGGPADKAGIQPGAVISQWDSKPVADALKSVTLQFANSSTPHGLLSIQLALLVRGPMGSMASVTFKNTGGQPQTVSLTRDTPQRVATGQVTPQVQDNKLPSGIGYIRISNFSDGRFVNTFDQAIDSLIKSNVPALILDVRSNPGGFSQVSDALAGRFFKEDYIVGKQITADGRWIYLDQVTPRGQTYTGCVELLVDVSTASAGDLFSYIFKASKRGIIVGQTPSAGMAGTVSGGRYDLGSNGFIQVPTGALTDSKGAIIVEGVGVQPDVAVPQTVASLLSPADEVLDAAVTAAAQCSVSK